MRKPRTLSFRKTCARPCCQVQLRPAGEVRRRGGASFGKGLVVRAPHLWYARITRSTVQENVRPRLHRCANHLASDDIG